MIFDDFLMVFERFALKRKSSKTLGKASKNHQQIILLLEKNQENLRKTMKTQGFGRFSFLFLAKG